MAKQIRRPGNTALRRLFKKAGFDWVGEMVTLYKSGELNGQAKLNALQTIAKYTEIEPRAATMTLTRSEDTNTGQKQLKASVVDNLPIEEVMRLASGTRQNSISGYREFQSAHTDLASIEEIPAPEPTNPSKRKAKRSK